MKIKNAEQEVTAFGTGAEREEKVDKGRFDLLPPAAYQTATQGILKDFTWPQVYAATAHLLDFQTVEKLEENLRVMCTLAWIITKKHDKELPLKALAVHFEQGGRNRGNDNWKKGIPLSSFISSGLRHMEQCHAGLEDEPHHRAFLWNMVSGLQTLLWVGEGRLPDSLLDVGQNSTQMLYGKEK
jgi:hypothetical protein